MARKAKRGKNGKARRGNGTKKKGNPIQEYLDKVKIGNGKEKEGS